MRVNGEWTLPCHVEGGRLIDNPHGFVYNYVLDRNHILLVDGRQCVTLGHDLDDCSMIRHRFFGSQMIVDNLRTAPSWDDDYVTVYGSQIG